MQSHNYMKSYPRRRGTIYSLWHSAFSIYLSNFFHFVHIDSSQWMPHAHMNELKRKNDQNQNENKPKLKKNENENRKRKKKILDFCQQKKQKKIHNKNTASNWIEFIYLEWGINNGEPIDGGGMVGVGKSVVDTAAASGCRKFRRWSTRSWCWVRHRVIISGSASSCSCVNHKHGIRFEK